jgi:SulP family sulfate permease
MSIVDKSKLKNIKNDILSGMVVAVALVPEAIAFSFIAGVSPIVGLYTAFILGLITALIGGKPGMISGATGAVAVVLIGLTLSVKQLNPTLSGDDLSNLIISYITLTAVMVGLIQIAIGLLKFGKFIRLVPQPALHGFVNGLAIVIAISQIKFLDSSDNLMYGIILGTMALMYLLPKVSRVVPAGLVAIVIFTFLIYILQFDTKLVGDLADLTQFSGMLPTFSIPDSIFSINTIYTILPYAVIIALVGVIESLLTLSILDEISKTRGNGNKECIAQGCGNIVCGFFGAMPGCAMIGQSIINYTSGGVGRLSALVAATGLMLLVAFLIDVLNVIPVGVLIGIMWMVSIGTFEWSSFARITKMPKSDAFVLVTVTIVTIVADLAIAVISGVIISALVFAWRHAVITYHSKIESDKIKIYYLNGPLFFGSVSQFSNEIFDVDNDPDEVVIDFTKTRVMDSSGIEAIDKVTKKYIKLGKSLKLRHLSEDCILALNNTGKYCIHEIDNPTYKVARDI